VPKWNQRVVDRANAALRLHQHGGRAEWLAADFDVQLDACAAVVSLNTGTAPAEWSRFRLYRLWTNVEHIYRSNSEPLAKEPFRNVAAACSALNDADLEALFEGRQPLSEFLRAMPKAK